MSLHSRLPLAGYLAYLLLGWDGVLIPSLVRTIEGTFRISDAALAFYYLLSSVLYAVGAFGSGIAIARLGRAWTLRLAVALVCAAHVGVAVVPAWPAFVTVAITTSAGRAVMDVGTGSVFLDVFGERRGSALNFLHLFFALGALIGPFSIGLLVSHGLNWRALFVWTAVPYALLLLLLLSLAIPGAHRSEHSGRLSLSVPLLLLALAIATYTGAEIGVNSWLVRLLHAQPLAVATGALSLFWGGLSAGRLLSRWAATWIRDVTFTALAALLASLCLAGGVLVPALIPSLALFCLAGFFYGPVYPMIMAVAGHLYPDRGASVTSALTVASALGVIVYPPFMGFVAGSVGLRVGMLGAAALGVLTAGPVLAAARARGTGIS